MQHPKTAFSFHRLFLLSTNEHISILAFSFQSRQPVSRFPFQPIRGWLNWLLCPLRGWKGFWLLCRARSSLSHCPSLHLPLSLSPSPPLTHTRLQALLWNRLSAISLSQYSLLMVSCSQTAAPLIRSVWLALHLSSNAGMAALICPQLFLQRKSRKLKSSWFFRIFWSYWSYIYIKDVPTKELLLKTCCWPITESMLNTVGHCEWLQWAVITELDQRKGRRRLGPMDRGEEKHSHISNLPHPSFHVQLIHGDIESIPRNPRDIIYPVSPGSTWSTFRRCQGDLRQPDVEEQWLCNESLSNNQVPHPVCEETHFHRCSVDQAEVGGWGPPVLGFQTSL